MDKSREQFQSWWEEWFGEAPLTPWNELWCGDGYSAEDIDHMWEAWQASRAAVEIELDAKVMVEDEFDKGHNCAIDYCADAIRAAGIKVKE
ncbi:hypothetical protein [Cronobacter sakazakii]|uniref:hypothetical protein n=1 Tax=Cronobacter sakazakii TaxID=28141 RepID=UPI000F5D6B32|nr:hypothetical protein [Cronobacter sakazakii]RRA46506.1 hypothetical protein C3O73_03130 [Cronobacter sakazakii]